MRFWLLPKPRTPNCRGFLSRYSAGSAAIDGFGGHGADADQLDNTEIAAIASYVFQQYGRAQTVSTDDVALVRQGGPGSPILLLARIGIGAGVLVVVLLGLILLLKGLGVAPRRLAGSV